MASSSCFVCPGSAAIYVSPSNSSGNFTAASWTKLPHTVTWELTPDVEEPTEIRTSDTAGKKVKPCAGATTWSLEVSSALCVDDWLYYYILNSPYDDPADPAYLWMALTWDSAVTKAVLDAGVAALPTGGSSVNTILCQGLVQPPGLGFDNDSSDPTQVEWSMEILTGPFFPLIDHLPDLPPSLDDLTP